MVFYNYFARKGLTLVAIAFFVWAERQQKS